MLPTTNRTTSPISTPARHSAPITSRTRRCIAAYCTRRLGPTLRPRSTRGGLFRISSGCGSKEGLRPFSGRLGRIKHRAPHDRARQRHSWSGSQPNSLLSTASSAISERAATDRPRTASRSPGIVRGPAALRRRGLGGSLARVRAGDRGRRTGCRVGRRQERSRTPRHAIDLACIRDASLPGFVSSI